MDSFLSHFTFRAGQCEDFVDRFLRLIGDNPGAKAERALAEILTFWDQSMAHPVKHPSAVDRRVKKVFIQNTGLEIIHRKPPGSADRIYNMAGNEFQNVFEQLRPSWKTVHVHKCTCEGDQYEYLSPVETYTPNMLLELNTPNGKPTKISRRKCKTCKSPFEYQSTMVGASTWFIPFPVDNDQELPTSWPVTLQFQSADSRLIADHVNFDLGYISYSSIENNNPKAVLHHTSLHLFGGQWYYYDDMLLDGRMRLTRNPSTFVARLRLRAVTVTYFRRDPPNVAERCSNGPKKKLSDMLKSKGANKPN
jgi:hypothetical protein